MVEDKLSENWEVVWYVGPSNERAKKYGVGGVKKLQKNARHFETRDQETA